MEVIRHGFVAVCEHRRHQKQGRDERDVKGKQWKHSAGRWHPGFHAVAIEHSVHDALGAAEKSSGAHE